MKQKNLEVLPSHRHYGRALIFSSVTLMSLDEFIPVDQDAESGEPDLVVVDGDGFRSAEGARHSIPSDIDTTDHIAEVRGPELQDWIENQMPHSDW